MSFFPQAGTAVFLIAVTLWVQCAGMAALIIWVRRAVARDVHKSGAFRSGRATYNSADRAPWIINSIVGELLSLTVLSVMGLGVLFFGKQLCNGGLWRCGSPIELEDVGSAREHNRRAGVRHICEPGVCDNHPAHRPRRQCRITSVEANI
jgi:hypothetical protein